MIKKICYLILPVLLCSCISLKKNNSQNKITYDYSENFDKPINFNRDTLIKVSPDAGKGFNFAYYLYLPAQLDKHSTPNLYVEPNNTGFPDDNLDLHDQATKKFIVSSYSSNIAKRLKSPMLVPVFPRPASQWQAYTHYLNRRTMQINKGPLKRIDLQLVQMIADARARLSEIGISTAPKIFMNGFSSSAGFTLRFTTIHPNLIQAAAAGGVNAMPILPIKFWKGVKLDYPIGVADLKEITGDEFALKTFLKVPQKIYMGSLDTNDTIPFRDAWDDSEAKVVQQHFGSNMQPDRWRKIQEIYNSTHANVDFSTYKDVGHKVTPEIEEDLFQFFYSHKSP